MTMVMTIDHWPSWSLIILISVIFIRTPVLTATLLVPFMEEIIVAKMFLRYCCFAVLDVVVHHWSCHTWVLTFLGGPWGPKIAKKLPFIGYIWPRLVSQSGLLDDVNLFPLQKLQKLLSWVFPRVWSVTNNAPSHGLSLVSRSEDQRIKRSVHQ